MSEPEHVGNILIRVLADIERRMDARAKRHRQRVVATVRDFHAHQGQPNQRSKMRSMER